MSFEFPDSLSSMLLDYRLMCHPGPDYDELIVPLSLYAFNRLSPKDQQEQLEQIRSHHEESDFTEVFKKLNYSDQRQFLSNVLHILKCHSFQHLDSEHQQQVIEQMVHLNRYSDRKNKDKNLLRDPEETEEDFRLRRFAQLSIGRSDAHKPTVARRSEDDEQHKTSDDNENKLNNNSSFSEFFLGFSFIWFQGQWASHQDTLIEQLSKGIEGVVIEKSLQKESEEDFKFARFTELCKKLVDFPVQVKFLDNAEQKLRYWGDSRLIIEPGNIHELFSDLSTLGFGLMSSKYQQHKIEEMSNTQARTFNSIIPKKDERQRSLQDLSEEATRMKRFRELFNIAEEKTRRKLFKELRTALLKHKRYSEAVHFFRKLNSDDQREMIEKLSDSTNLITEKLSSESEDSRLTRFKEVCMKHLSSRDYILWPEADKERVRLGTSDFDEQESPYAEFLFEVAITWFKSRCANYWRNPIHVILSSQVQVIEKLPEESEVDFRLRRFRESFKRLQISSQERIVDYIIQNELFLEGLVEAQSYEPPPEGRWLFDSEWVKIKLPNLQGQGAPATIPPLVSAAGSATTTQATTTKQEE